MINTTKDIVFLKEGNDLSDAVHEAITTVWDVLRDVSDFQGDPYAIVSTDNSSLFFLKFFGNDFHLENKNLSKDDVCKLYKSIFYSVANPPSIESMRDYLLCADKPESMRGKLGNSYYGGIKLGLQLVFVRLWKERVVVLPYDFEPPRCEFIFEDRFRAFFFTQVLSSVRIQNSRFNTELKYKDLNTRKMFDSRAVCWLKLAFATTWYEVGDLNLDELLNARIVNCDKSGGLTNGSLQMHLLIQVFLDYFGDKLQFTEIEFDHKNLEYYESLGSTKNANTVRRKLGLDEINSSRVSVHNIAKTDEQKLADGICRIQDELYGADENELVKAISSLTMSHLGNTGGIFEKVYQQVIPTDYHKAVKYWLELQRLYAVKKKYEKPKKFMTNLGLLNAYFFIYLPYWYANQPNQHSLPAYPDTLNLLNCEIFINRWTEHSDDLPLDFINFINLISAHKRWINNTHYGMLHPLLMFLRWCDNKKRRLTNADQFENLLDTDDLPEYSKYAQSKKTPLARRLFKMFIRFSYALEGFQSQISKKVEAGKLNPALLGGHRTFINFVDESCESNEKRHLAQKRGQPIDFCLSDHGIDRPTVSFEDEGGEQYPINSIYRFFFHKDYKVKGKNKTLIYPGDLNCCLLAMETGIRGNHLRWLDLDTFDMRVNLKLLDDYLHPLTVNTDKVRTSPWVSTVSASVIATCLKQKEWRSKISNPAFNELVFYGGNKTSKFGAFRPLFSYSPTSGSTTPNMDRCFLALLMTFDQFLVDNGFDEERMYRIRPADHKYFGEIDPTRIETKLTNQGHEYTKIIYAKRTTVHACRNSVVSDRTRYLPESIVGKYITNQSERLVTYYNIRDPEDHYADQNRQWLNKPSEVKVDIPMSDESLGRELPTNSFNTAMYKGITENPNEAIDAYGLISIHLITDTDGNIEDGLSMLRAKKYIKLACNSTHYCPFDNVCPKEIIEELGEMKPCALCPYAISGVNHIPAISAVKDACFEEYEDVKEKLVMLRKEKPKELEMILEAGDRCNQLLMHAHGWKYRESDLKRKVGGIKKGFDGGEFTVGKPEFIANMLEQTCFKASDNEGAYLLKRLRDCKAFPLLETKKIAAKFEMAKRKLMAVKDPSSVLNFDVSINPVKELYSLIHSYKDIHGIKDAQIIKILNMTPTHLLEHGSSLEFKD